MQDPDLRYASVNNRLLLRWKMDCRLAGNRADEEERRETIGGRTRSDGTLTWISSGLKKLRFEDLCSGVWTIKMDTEVVCSFVKIHHQATNKIRMDNLQVGTTEAVAIPDP